MASSPIKLALLLCDTPLAQIVEFSGDYTQIFNKLLFSSLPSSDAAKFTLDPYDVVHKQEYPPDDSEYDGILLTGSAASAYQNLEWINKLVAYIASIAKSKPHVKIIGICFGHQIIARAFGGECVPNGGQWEVGVTTVNLTGDGQRVFGVDTINIQQMHRDHVPGVPAGFHLLGSTSVTPNQGMIKYSATGDERTLENIHVLCVQGHPEFTAAIVATLVDAREASGVLNADIARDARKRAAWRNDGVSVIGRAIWRVFGVKP